MAHQGFILVKDSDRLGLTSRAIALPPGRPVHIARGEYDVSQRAQ